MCTQNDGPQDMHVQYFGVQFINLAYFTALSSRLSLVWRNVSVGDDDVDGGIDDVHHDDNNDIIIGFIIARPRPLMRTWQTTDKWTTWSDRRLSSTDT